MTQLKKASAILASLSACMTLSLTGCGTRTVLVPPGEAVRLRENVKARIWAADKDGKQVPGRVILPEGWYAVPPPTNEPTSLKPVGFILHREGRGDGAATRKIITMN